MEKTPEEILDQAVYAVACVAHHYGPPLSQEGLSLLRGKLAEMRCFCTDSTYRVDVYEDDEFVDFIDRIVWPEDWDTLNYEEVIQKSRRKEYEVWEEGHKMNGSCSAATFLGKFKAESFTEACRKAAKWNEKEHLFDEIKLSIWGCRLFDNEVDARKSFG